MSEGREDSTTVGSTGPLRIRGGLSLRVADVRIDLLGQGEQVDLVVESLHEVQSLANLLRSVGGESLPVVAAPDSSRDKEPTEKTGPIQRVNAMHDWLCALDLTLELHTRRGRIARLGPRAQPGLPARMAGFKFQIDNVAAILEVLAFWRASRAAR